MLYSSKLHVLLTVLALLSFTTVSFILLERFFVWLDSCADVGGVDDAPTASKTRPAAQAKLFLLYFLLFLVAWSPYAISFAPGSDCPDIAREIAQFMGLLSYSTQQPLYATFIYGAVFSLGHTIGGISGGVMALVALQTLSLSLSLSFEMLALTRLGAPRAVLVVACVFFAVVPVFGTYCQWAVKDSLFGSCFALYVTLTVLFAKQAASGQLRWTTCAGLAVSALLVALLRNNGFYVVALSAPFFCFLVPGGSGRRLTCLALTLVVIGSSVGLNQVAKAVTGAAEGSIKEALSIPFQQTARYAIDHGDEVSLEERETINAVLPYDELPERYKWYISDPVKSRFTGNTAALPAYFEVWAGEGLRHPVTYLEATLDQTYGYWSVMADPNYRQEFTGTTLSEVQDEILGDDVIPVNGLRFFPDQAERMWQVLRALRTAPFLNLLCQVGFYTLFLLVLAAYALYRGKKRALTVLLPAFVLLLTCIAGPLNGSVRYGFGIIAGMPVMVYGITLLTRSRFPQPRSGGADAALPR